MLNDFTKQKLQGSMTEILQIIFFLKNFHCNIEPNLQLPVFVLIHVHVGA